MVLQWKTWDKVVLAQAAKLENYAVRRIEGTLKPEDLYIPTGLKRWDANGGITRGVLTIIGSVDGQGKSLMRAHLAKSAAQCGLEVAELVFEDPEEQVANRSIANQTGIDSRKLSLATFNVADMDKIYAAAKATQDWGNRIHYHSGLVGVDDVFGALDGLVANSKLDLVLLDYAQAFQEGDIGLERTIAHLAWDANVFAQKHNVGFVIFSQVKPEVSGRGHAVHFTSKKRDPDSFDVSGFLPGPGTQDLAWSSAFGQRGRCVAYLMRPGYYERMLGKPGALDDRLWVRIAKANFGNSGLMELKFDGPTGRIYE